VTTVTYRGGMLIEPRRRRIGSDEIDRLLPFRARRTVGPFIYADLIGPTSLPSGVGVDVPVHPHIGLATVTYLFDGALVHRDSTGAVQRIEPGAVNWMTAGRGVAHSERSPDDERADVSTIAGLQTWVALPDDAETVDPSFVHVPEAEVPAWRAGPARCRLIAGTFGPHRSPVPVVSPIGYVDVVFDDAGSWTASPDVGERGVLVVSGPASVDGVPVPERHLLVLDGRAPGMVRTSDPARVVLLGGASVGERVISWNFVSSDRDRIDRGTRRVASARLASRRRR
jgi:redox-sensitive bicupin YhaK (pirin superfamily)